MRGPGLDIIPRLQRRLHGRERGVSEVVGAAILIGIAVVLATVIAGFALDFAPDQQSAPDATLEISQDRVDKDWAVNGSTRVDRNVLQIRTMHRGGEQVLQSTIAVRIDAESKNASTGGFLLGYNDSDDFNVTESGWNTDDGGAITSGNETRYEFFATTRLGKDESAVDGDIEDLWGGETCRVVEFKDNRDVEGPIKLDGIGAATDNCPFGSINATIGGGQITEGGRIVPGDTVRIVWSPSGSSSSSILRTYDVVNRRP